ncbi:MAG: cation diffusion facilitator family transporter [Alphaproteobacteria bacterium]|nr:cation diffusion facilitator family transporter [Alphaproteobacteria bacterium]
MAGGSKLAVYAAIGANSVVTLAKFVGFALTGSGAMFSEGIHSTADVGNQVLLAVGMKRASRPPDDDHPAGYGREAFVWALISAVGIFFLGCGVTVMHGIESLQHPHVTHEDQTVNIAILLFALVAEGATLAIAVRGLRHQAHELGIGFVEHLKTTDDPFGVAVLLEDSAAVTGVLIALAAVALSEWTHQPYWDAIGSLAIGALLGLVAVFLIWKNAQLLVGRAVHPRERDAIRAILESEPAIERIVQQKALVVGAEAMRISAELDFDGAYFAERFLDSHDLDAIRARIEGDPDALRAFLAEFGEAVVDDVGDEVDRIEARIRAAMPKAGIIALEPD